MKIQLRQGDNWFDVEADEVKIDGVKTNGVTVAHYVFTEEIIVIKPKFEKGKWYFTKNKGSIFLFNGKYDERGNPLGYGFATKITTFREASKLGWDSQGIEAPKEQIENAFINHFKKLGFEKGVKFRSLGSSNIYQFAGDFDFIYLSSHEEVYNLGLGRMYKAGEFAKTIKY